MELEVEFARGDRKSKFLCGFYFIFLSLFSKINMFSTISKCHISTFLCCLERIISYVESLRLFKNFQEIQGICEEHVANEVFPSVTEPSIRNTVIIYNPGRGYVVNKE